MAKGVFRQKKTEMPDGCAFSLDENRGAQICSPPPVVSEEIRRCRFVDKTKQNRIMHMKAGSIDIIFKTLMVRSSFEGGRASKLEREKGSQKKTL